jgi:hypothetical protein
MRLLSNERERKTLRLLSQDWKRDPLGEILNWLLGIVS